MALRRAPDSRQNDLFNYFEVPHPPYPTPDCWNFGLELRHTISQVLNELMKGEIKQRNKDLKKVMAKEDFGQEKPEVSVVPAAFGGAGPGHHAATRPGWALTGHASLPWDETR